MILVVGDSLSASYGIEFEQGWVALLGQRLEQMGFAHRVVNASITGDTTAGGLARLERALPRHRPAVVVIELGGNDGLRGIPLHVIERNLDSMIEMSREAGAEVALLGIQIPSNYGPRYTQRFRDLYTRLSERHGLPEVDFLLEGVALDADLMQSDGIHPNGAAQPILLDNAWPAISGALSASCAQYSTPD